MLQAAIDALMEYVNKYPQASNAAFALKKWEIVNMP